MALLASDDKGKFWADAESYATANDTTVDWKISHGLLAAVIAWMPEFLDHSDNDNLKSFSARSSHIQPFSIYKFTVLTYQKH